MKGRIRKHVKEIERLAGVRIVLAGHTGGTHLRLAVCGLPRAVTCSASPSDCNSLKAAAQQIKRLLNASK
jgi:hypothetical protein